MVDQFQERLSFPNPRWLENDKRGYSRWQVPAVLRCSIVQDGRLFRRRGFIRTALWILKEYGIASTLDDRRRSLSADISQFWGKSKDSQLAAVEAALARDFGVLAATLVMPP